MQNRSLHYPVALGDSDYPRGGNPSILNAIPRGGSPLGFPKGVNRQHSTGHKGYKIYAGLSIPGSGRPTIYGAATFVVSHIQ